jgi:proline iminopeptidase
VILLGHSFGGFLGLEYALKFPDRVAGLILVASAAHLKFVRETGKATKHFPQVAQAQKTYLESNRDEIALKKLILASIPLYFSKGFELEAKSLLAKINYGAKCYAELIKNYHSQFSLLKQLADINVPCLVIAGENDLPIPPKYSLEMVEQLQDAEYAELKTGHFPFVEKPSEFNEIVLTWLRNRHLLDA